MSATWSAKRKAPGETLGAFFFSAARDIYIYQEGTYNKILQYLSGKLMAFRSILFGLGIMILNTVTSSANATLLSRGEGLVYDTDANVTWIGDFDYLGSAASRNPTFVQDLISKVPIVFALESPYDRYDHPATVRGAPYQLSSDDFFLRNGDVSPMTWYGAQALASQINIKGVSGWRVAGNSVVSGGTYENEIQHLVVSEFNWPLGGSLSAVDKELFRSAEGALYGLFWQGSYFDGYNGSAWLPQLNSGGVSTPINRAYALFVHDGDVAVVPEPATVLLILAGVLPLVTRRKAGSIYRPSPAGLVASARHIP